MRPADWPRLVTETDREDGVGDEIFERLSYELTFARASEPRFIADWGIMGPDLDNSYGTSGTRTKQDGEWVRDLSYDDDDPVRHVLACAVHECVHEALEWARLNGRPILNPHGPAEARVNEAVDVLVRRLFELACEEAVEAMNVDA